jgi:uncharacterized membrane protein
MEWFFFALAAMLIFPLCNVISKIILTKKINDVLSYNLLTYIFDIFLIILFVLVLKITLDFTAALSILYGFSFFFLWILYFHAIKKEEVSRVALTRSSVPIFVLILSSIFLGESLSLNNYIGIGLLVVSSVLASYKKSGKKFHLSAAFGIIIIFVFGSALMGILSKYTMGFTDYWNFFLWSTVGGQIGSLMFLIVPKLRRNLAKQASMIERRTWLMLLVSYLLGNIGYVFYYSAISMAKISLISALMSARPMLLFLYALALTIFMPHILKEDVSRSSLIMKGLAGIMVIIGSYLIVS